MGSVCSASKGNQIVLTSLSPCHSALSKSPGRSSSIPVPSITSSYGSCYSDSGNFQIYPHYSVINDGVQSRNGTFSSPAEFPTLALKQVEPVMCWLPGIADFSPFWKQVITGQVNQKLLDKNQVTRSEDRVIYIYHCANYGDSVQERQALHDEVYPTLREYCSQRGVTVEVIDLTLGVSHYSAHGHACKKMSQKVLTDLTSHKEHCTIVTIFFNDNDPAYSYPLKIKKEDFHLMLKKCTQDETHFLLNCYKLDETLKEHCYVVQDFNPKEGEKIHIRLRNIINSASSAEFQKQQQISDVERDLTLTGMHQNQAGGHKFWIRRNFTEIDWDHLSPKGYRMYNTEEGSYLRRTNFSEVLKKSFQGKNIIQSDVKWSKEGINQDLEDHKIYLDMLTSSYSDTLLPMMDKIMDSFEELGKQKIQMRSKGLTDTLYKDLLHQMNNTLQLQQSVLGQNDLVEELETYLTEEGLNGNKTASQPLLLRGCTGSGKSAIASVLANNVYGVTGWKNSCCVMKSAHASTECATLEQMVYCLAEQLCILSGLPVRLVYEQKMNILHHLLNPAKPEIFQSPPLLIILDGLDHLDNLQQAKGFSDLSWLPTLLPKHVRMVITATTDSDMADKIQMELPKTNIKDIPRLFMADAMVCLSGILSTSANRFLLFTDQEKVMLLMKEKPPSLFTELLCSFIDFMPDSLDDVVQNVKIDCEKLMQRYLHALENCYGTEVVSYICCLLSVSRHGICMTELIALCQKYLPQHKINGDSNSCDTESLSSIDQVSIYSIIEALKHFLAWRTSQGLMVMKWKYLCFEKVLQMRYGPKYIEMAVQNLTTYFNNIYVDSRAENCSTNEKNTLESSSQNITVSPDILRAMDELPYAYHCSRGRKDLCKILASPSFILSKIKYCGVQHLLMDFHLALCQSDTRTHEGRQMEEFVKVLEKLIAVSLFSPSAFDIHLTNYNQFCGTSPSNKKTWFSPVDPNKTGNRMPKLQTKCILDDFCYGYQDKISSNYTFSELYHIKGDTDHVVGLATESDELQVINIHSGECHRILRGVEKPRALRAVNMLEMVILCDREMRIYNVDQGTLLCTLKGVMNLSLPCFEVQSEQYTMAVSRNRMHINMYENSTGDVSTTFKVGEDRFLNSLLVSDNGEYCVCGDEVRKPFPLLVWDLKHRKLIHDLRIRGHEFITKVSALTKDGSLLVCASHEVDSSEPNFLLVYEVQNGALFTKLQTEFSCTAVAISKEANHVVSAYENGEVLVWHLSDTVKTSPRFRLQGHTVGVDKLLLCEDGNTGVTYDSTGKDPFIWMWDFKQGTPIGCVQALISPSCCLISADGNTLVACYPGLDKILTFGPPNAASHEPNTNSVYGDASRKGEVFYFKENKCSSEGCNKI